MRFTVFAIYVEVVSHGRRIPDSIVYKAMSAQHTCLNIVCIKTLKD